MECPIPQTYLDQDEMGSSILNLARGPEAF